ncbi:MAG: ABC transporter ATP-binding protein [Acidobacteria bacterium]|nr:ABC transporter ATP-binding protein [Acidobacteriota bacterium]
MSAAIEIAGLSKQYSVGFWRKRPRIALQPLHMEVQRGEVFGYLGHNGAGKTTTLKLLMGLIFPTAGSARVLNLDIGDPAMKERIGFLPEQPYFYDYLTAPELLTYFAQLSGINAGNRERRVRTALIRVGLRGIDRLQLRKFSKGMLQRVGLAQAILHDPEVVILDEPMSGLDPIGRREVRDLIQSLKDDGKTILFSTHILSDAESLCDRVAVLQKGRLRVVGRVSELTASVQGRMEVTWRDAPAEALGGLAVENRAGGDCIRSVVLEAELDAALQALRRARGRLISVTPIRRSLEQYFLEQGDTETNLGRDNEPRLQFQTSETPPFDTERIAELAK